VFPRLKRRQADFFKSGNPGLLAVARLTMREEEDGVENGNGDGSLSDSILTNRIMPIEDLRTEIIEDLRTEIIHELILVANAVRYTCDLVEVSGPLYSLIIPVCYCQSNSCQDADCYSCALDWQERQYLQLFACDSFVTVDTSPGLEQKSFHKVAD
jgi:hypothetical protein